MIERSLPNFDLALLRFSPLVADLAYVYLDKSFQADDSLYIYGYPDDFSHGASVTGKCEGIATDKQPLIKFKAGQIRPGLSGSPLLNQLITISFGLPISLVQARYAGIHLGDGYY